MARMAGAAALLASHDIPALAIAYFDAPGLPCRLQGIPLEYFARAIQWLRSQPQVDPGRVWILGLSRGTEAEMLVAAHWPALVHGVIADSPNSVVDGPFDGVCPGGSTGPAWTLDGRAAAPTLEPLPVKRILGPVMLVSGGADILWPSDVQANEVMRALPPNGAAHVHLNYPSAGHIVLSLPYLPPTTAYGGTVPANEAAHERAWPAMLRFIAGH